MEARDFSRHLVRAIAWCAPRADAANPMTCPRSPSDPLAKRNLVQSHDLLVSEVLRDRELALGPRPSPVDVTGAGGRLVVYFPDDATSSGGPALGGKGFFDLHECPPWDTWVGYFRDDVEGLTERYLVAWVPPPLLGLAQAGIDAAQKKQSRGSIRSRPGYGRAIEADRPCRR